MKKKIVAAFLAVLMLASMFTGCGNKEIATDSTAEVEAPEIPTDITEVDETEPVTEEDTNTNSDADTKEAGAEQEKIYAPAIEDDIKDEVLAAYQKYMDDNGWTQCAFIGMDNSELPLLRVRDGGAQAVVLYSDGTVTGCEKSGMLDIEAPGKIICQHPSKDDSDIWVSDYYEIVDGKMNFRGTYVMGDGFHFYDAEGNQVSGVSDLWELEYPEYPESYDSIYEAKYLPVDEGGGDWLDNVEDAYLYRNVKDAHLKVNK